MITKVTVRNFKRFRDPTEFTLKPEGITFLAGGNNSGKSTLLQALAVWEFARTVIEINKGTAGLQPGANYDGIGVSAEEFSPIALPDLKHLWSNLTTYSGQRGDSYTMRIRCDWAITAGVPVNRHLEVGLNLSNERIFIKRTESDLAAGDAVPRLAYLPPFAGIGRREERMSPASRKGWIGRGLAGAVLRNLIYDLWEVNRNRRNAARKTPKGRIPAKALAEIRRDDSWERLLQALEEVFKTGLTVAEFNELYNTVIRVAVWDGHLVQKQFRRIGGTAEKDLMSEGSGFLQWLSVYALAVNDNLDVLLLDEPDAHLHPALQAHLLQKLSQLAREHQKQVLLATHSTTILGETNVDRIFRMEDRGYLVDERGRVGLFVGLGSQYAPRLDQLKRSRKLFLHDGPSDLEVLRAWGNTLGIVWPADAVCWKYTKDREAREILFTELRSEIDGLRAISLQDRDDYPFAQTAADLTFDNLALFVGGLGLRRWRRRNLENYLLHPTAIARAAGRGEQEVRDFLQNIHGLAIPGNFTDSNCIQTLANTDGKEITTKNVRSVSVEFGVSYLDIAKGMTVAEIPDDPKTLLQQLATL